MVKGGACSFTDCGCMGMSRQSDPEIWGLSRCVCTFAVAISNFHMRMQYFFYLCNCKLQLLMLLISEIAELLQDVWYVAFPGTTATALSSLNSRPTSTASHMKP